MSDNESLLKVKKWLQEEHDEIMDCEESGLHVLFGGDVEGYANQMRQKAEMIAALPEECEPLLKDLSEEHRDLIKHALDNFASGAKMALHLNSVFYMSSLLYPNEPREGVMDNLQKFINHLAPEAPVRHIVWWNLKAEAQGRSAAENALRIFKMGSALKGLPGVNSIEISTKIQPGTTVTTQVALISTHASMADLETYKNTPSHLEFTALASQLAESCNVINYLIEP